MASINATELMDIEKFTMYIMKKIFNGKKRIRGTFRIKGSKEIITGDVFDCLNIQGDALESYKCAIAYFNRTIQTPHEKERIAVSAEWVEEKDEINTIKTINKMSCRNI